MHKTAFTSLSAALAFALCMPATAADMTKQQYSTGKSDIAAQYKTAKTACNNFKSNERDICMQEAKGRDKVAMAELDARNDPSAKRTYQVAVAKSDAAFAVAKEKCDDLAGNTKDVCREEAKRAHVASLADAKMTDKTKESNAEAAEKISNAKGTAAASNASAQKDAASDVARADYKLAAEKCDAMAGDAKTSCVTSAKAKFGQN